MSFNKEIYIQLKDNLTVVRGSSIIIRDIVTIIGEKSMKERILNLQFMSTNHQSKEYMVVSLLSIVEKIKIQFSDVEVIPVGAAEVLIRILEPSRKEKKLFSMIKLVSVAAVLFVGTGLAIMNFHADVNMSEAHTVMYRLITGIEEKRPLIMQIPYSLGIGIGMALFFNHILPRKKSNAPSPMDVEMYLYQKNMEQFILDNEKNTEEN